MLDPIPPENIWRVDPTERTPIPFYMSTVQAGFPSPAENYIRERLSLDELCVQHPNDTYFVEAAGDSMIDDYIYPGSILVVDSLLPVENGKVVVGWVNGECTVKRLVRFGEMAVLFPSNPEFLPIYVHKDRDRFDILGVVIRIVSQPPRWDRDQLKTALEYVRTRGRQ